MYHSFCGLCGVVLSHYEGPLPPPAPLPWAGEIRAVRVASADDNAFISGAGVVEEGSFRASFEPSVSYLDHPDVLEVHDLGTDQDPAHYLLHDACWQLLLSRLTSGRASDPKCDPCRVAKLIFSILRCFPKDRHGGLLTLYDYGGASGFRQSYGYARTGYERGLPEDWVFLLADPSDATNAISGSLNDLPNVWRPRKDSAIDNDNYRQTSRSDPFRRLPLEVIHLLLLELPSASLCKLRLASRVIANVSAPADLSQSFWESRFASSFEMGFFFAGKRPPMYRRSINFYRLYGLVRESLATGPSRPSLQNRRRIWMCLSHFCATLEPLLDCDIHDWPPTQLSPPSDALPDDGRPGPSARTQAQHTYATQYLPLRRSKSNSSPLRLSASFISFNYQRYLSGLRSDQVDESSASQDSVGIIIPRAEEHVDLTPDEILDGVRVHSTADGIVGLELLLRNEGTRAVSLGQCSVSNDVAVAQLHPGTASSLSGLMATLDACKFTGIQLVECTPEDLDRPSEETRDVECSGPGSGESILWKPDILAGREVALVSASANTSDSDDERSPVRLNMDFGGPDGRKLAHLNRVVAIIDSYIGLFKGFEFHYDDGTSAFYGSRLSVDTISSRKPCIEVSFVLCGSRGERVTEIRAVKGLRYRREHIRGLQFSTNMGSQCFFAAHEKSCMITLSETFATFKPMDGDVLTGLVADLTSVDGKSDFHGIFNAVGIVGSPEARHLQDISSPSNSFPPTVPVSEEQMALSPHIMRGISGGCITNTSLECVRTIRFSAGVDGRSRTDSFISGLWVQFHSSEKDSIVGQWFEEVDSLDIDDGDYITHVRIWYTQEANPANTNRENNGKVAGMMLSTSRGVCKRVLRQGLEGMICIDFHTNPLEKIHGLVWCFSYSFDHIQVLRRLDAKHAAEKLHLESSHMMDPRSIHEARRFLWTEIDRAGNESPLSAIEAFFDRKHLTGLRFAYGVDVETSVGPCEGERVSISLQHSENIVAIDYSSYPEGNVLVVR